MKEDENGNEAQGKKEVNKGKDWQEIDKESADFRAPAADTHSRQGTDPVRRLSARGLGGTLTGRNSCRVPLTTTSLAEFVPRDFQVGNEVLVRELRGPLASSI